MSGSGSAVEIVPGALYALGGVIPCDGRVTWAPGSSGFVAFNAYLLADGGSYALLDPGPVVHERALLEQLEPLVPRGSELALFLTRAELDCIGAIGALGGAYRISRILAGGRANPFDQFRYVTDVGPARRAGWVMAARDAYRDTVRFAAGERFRISSARTLEVVPAPLKLLAAFWAYDDATRTLFTSDVFGHGRGETEDEARSPAGCGELPDAHLREGLLAKFWWLRYANLGPIRSAFEAVHAGREIENICPGHGRPILGRDAVEHAFARLDAVLAELEAAEDRSLQPMFDLPPEAVAAQR